MKVKVFGVLLLAVLLGGLAISVSAQDMPSPQVNVASDMLIMNGAVDIGSVYSEGPGFIVIHRTSDGGVVGVSAPLAAGWTNNVRIPVDVTMAEAQMSAMLHVDDNTVGTYEFGTVEGADSPVRVGEQIVNPIFNAHVLTASDQRLTDNTVVIDSVTMPEGGWVVIHSGDASSFGGVLGQTLVPAGTTTNVAVELSGDVTTVLWPMLHVDTGEVGTYEFGSVEGADTPVVVNGQVASIPLWTVNHLRVKDQVLLNSDGTTSMEGQTPRVHVDSVLSEGPGIVVIHANDNGNAGAILGAFFVEDGVTKNFDIDLDTAAGITPVVWPMLHIDAGTVGTYDGLDVDTVASANGEAVTFTSNIAPALVMSDQAAVDGTITITNALMDGPGWLALHSDNEGRPGPVVATAQLHPGANWNVKVTLPEGTAAGMVFFPMLHVDTGEVGVYEFGSVEGADTPVSVGGNVVVGPLTVTE